MPKTNTFSLLNAGSFQGNETARVQAFHQLRFTQVAGEKNTLHSGHALEKLGEMVEHQGGDPRAVYDPALLPTSPFRHDVVAPREGYLCRLDAGEVGVCALLLGAGRQKKSDPVDHTAGLILHRAPGDRVFCGEPLATLFASSPSLFPEAEKRFLSAVDIGEEKPEPPTLIYGIL